MQHTETITDSLERITTKQRSAVQREVVRLLDELVPQRPAHPREEPHAEVKLHRWPGRCILQAESSAVSVSWFPARPDEDSLGEILVIAWDGIVSLPGSAERSRREAVARRTVVVRPVETRVGEYEWRREGAASPIQTATLANFCRELLA